MTILDHLAAIQVVAPLLAAPLCVFLRVPLFCWSFAVAISSFCVVNSILILRQIEASGVIVYSLGGWIAPYGIEYRIDSANAYVLIIISIINLITLLYAKKSLQNEISNESQGWIYSAWILCFTGLTGITISGDVFNVFVFLEISSLSTYVLISFGSNKQSLTAAFRYLIVGTVAATFYLIGIGLLYALTGSLNMADLATLLPDVTSEHTMLTAFGFIVIGLAIKMALFPFHSWLPNAYTYAPNAITAFLSGTATKAAVYVFGRLVLTVFPDDYFSGLTSTGTIIVVVGIAGAIVASATAFFQNDIKRMFAWSSIAQVGYMAVGLGLATTAGIAAAFLHLFNHALMKTAVFMAIGALVYSTGTSSIRELRNAGRKMPWTMAAILVGGLSLVGVPSTTGFISKWYLVSAAFEQNFLWLAVLILVSSLVSAAYVWKIVEAAYFDKSNEGTISREEAPLTLLIPTWILVLANIYFGINAQFTASQAMLAAEAILGISP